MSSPNAQPNPAKAFSKGNLPQIFVRAEKHYLCSSCGTLVEIPADVVGKLGWAGQQPRQQPPVQEVVTSQASPQASEHAVPASQPAHSASVQTEERPPRSGKQPSRPPRPNRPQPLSVTWAGRTIDGLTVPTGEQLDLALKWITYYLKLVDRHDSEIKLLKKRLKKQRVPRKNQSTPRVPRPSPLGRAKDVTLQEPREPSGQPPARHAHADVSMAPASDNRHERGPP